MLEAKAQITHGEFQNWVKRNFKVSLVQAQLYMKLARETEGQKLSALSFSSLGQFQRETGVPNYNKPHTVRPPAWHDAVKRIAGQVDVELLNRRDDELKRLLADTPETLEAFESACIGKHGTNQYSKKEESSNPTILQVDRGKAYTLRRLKRQHPALFTQVTTGALTAHQALPTPIPS